MRGKNRSKKKKKGRDLSKIKIPVWAKKDKLIWVEIRDKKDILPLNYYEAIVASSNEETKKVKVSYTGSQKGPDEVWADRISERSEIAQSIEDLVDIDPLNDAELLRCLQVRFENDDIACFCGPTLIATNPYKRVPKAMLKKDKIMFRKYALGEGKIISKPHIWNTAARTFRQIFDNEQKQAVCISGESGAGKTFLTEMVMAFITSLFEDEEGGGGNQDNVPIEKKILGCNPIMENFGNAKTVRNNNSSRFGKYFIMYVDRGDKHIHGAQIKNYLLEKSRIITQAKTERNYHIFYGIMNYMESKKLKEYGFCNDGDKPKMDEFEYLKKSECYSLPLNEDVKEGEYADDDEEFYVETCNSLKNLGFSSDESDAIFKILACVLNLGNVPIDLSTYEEGVSPCKLTKNVYLDKVLKNLGLEYDELSDSCCSKVRNLPGGLTTKSPRTASQAESIRDALAKDLYNNCFNWVIRKLNLTLLPKNVEKYTSVGLLDIFGFEDFNTNSLEQFCINFTNEKLQSLYNSYVFQAEIDTYKEEGLDEFIHLIKFTSNDPVMDLMAKNKNPAGIFNLLDSVAVQANNDKKDHDKKLVTDIVNMHKDNEFFGYNRLKPDLFMIKHTAKDVNYFVKGFVEKNKDELPFNLIDVLNKGDKEIVKIFNLKLTHDEVVEKKKKNPKEKFLGYKFKKEMESLMEELLACECNFVRAIKPNELKTKDLWVPELALCQIKYLGILDSINVRRDSLPVRKKFKKFYEKYQDLDEKSEQRLTSFLKLKDMDLDWKTMSLNVIESLPEVNKNEILSGRTRIFMSVNFQNYMLEKLEEKQKIKKDALKKIIEGFKKFDFSQNWNVQRKEKVAVGRIIRSFKAYDFAQKWNVQRKEKMAIGRITRSFKAYDFAQNWNHYRRRKTAVIRIAKNFKIFDFAKNWNEMRRSNAKVMMMSRDLFKSWDCKAEYNKFRKFLYFVKKGQEIFRTRKRKAEMKRQWKSAQVIGRAYQMYKTRVLMTNAKKIITALKKCSRKMIFKAQIARIRISKRALEVIFEKAWIKIMEVEHENAIKTIQRIWRGHDSRVKSERLNASETIQRIWRGHDSRVKAERINASEVIQRIWRGHDSRVKAEKINASEVIQRIWRGHDSRVKAERLNASEIIQRIWRGFMTRLENLEDVEEFQLRKGQIEEKMATIVIQRYFRGFMIRNRLDRLNRAAGYLQGYMRMLWLTKYFKLMRVSAIKIQKLARKYLFRKSVIKEREKGYYHKLETEKNILREIESKVIFKRLKGVKELKPETLPVKLSWFKKRSKFMSKIPEVKTFTPKIPDFEQNPKMKIFSILIDFDCQFDTRNIYRYSWGSEFLKFQEQIQEKETRLLHLEAGTSFTLAFTRDSKIYSWGLNDSSQLARPRKRKKNFYPPENSKILNQLNPKIISCGDEHTLLVDYSGNLYTWGGNMNAQLGIGTCQKIPSIMKLKQFQNKTQTAITQGRISYALTNDGKVWKWPFKNSNLSPKILNPGEKFRISNISCGLGFLIALTENGMVYSTGNNNEGQLGLGHKNRVRELRLVETFKELKEKVLEVSCGASHTIAKTFLGRVYVWGFGGNGQLGTGSGLNSEVPCVVNPYNDRKRHYKAVSVQAGFSVSYILNNDRNVYYAGESMSEDRMRLSFTRLDFEEKVFGFENITEFSPLRLKCSWSKSLTLLSMIYGDFRGVNSRIKERDELCRAINSQWSAECKNQIFPPVNEITTRKLCPRYLKKEGSEKAPMSVRYTSGKKTKRRKGLFSSPRKKKLTMSEKLDALMKKPHYQWSAEDKKLMESVREFTA